MVSLRRAALSLSVLLLALPLGAAPPAAPNAYDLFRQVRQAYSDLSSYRDHGQIEIVAKDRKVERTARYDTLLDASADGGFRYVVQPQGHPEARRVVWREGKGSFAYDARLGQVRPVDSLLAEALGGFGEIGYDALVVPALLAGGGGALAEPEVAKVEGSGPCGGESCWQLLVSKGGGAEARLWVDQATHTIRQVEVRFPKDPSRRSIRVTHEIEAVDEPVAAASLAFAPPAGTKRVAEWERGELGGRERTGAELDGVFGGEITVALETMVARVLKPDGTPVLGLKPEDFRVRIGKMEVPVVAVDWVSSLDPKPAEPGEAPEPPAISSSTAAQEPLGRQVVFFVEADLEPVRITGQLGLLPLAEDLLKSLGPEDQVAVVSFDSRLKLWLDWTQDHEAVMEALAQAVRFGGNPAVPRSQDPASLTRYFDEGAAKRAGSASRALELTARSLVPLPGDKVVVFLGWGFRRWEGVGTYLELEPSLRALRAAQASVFVLDITQAGGHPLEVGLRLMAAATGGTYAKTYGFPQKAVNALARAITGHYVLTVDRSSLPAKGGDLRVDLTKKSDARVLIRAGELAPS